MTMIAEVLSEIISFLVLIRLLSIRITDSDSNSSSSSFSSAEHLECYMAAARREKIIQEAAKEIDTGHLWLALSFPLTLSEFRETESVKKNTDHDLCTQRPQSTGVGIG